MKTKHKCFIYKGRSYPFKSARARIQNQSSQMTLGSNFTVPFIHQSSPNAYLFQQYQQTDSEYTRKGTLSSQAYQQTNSNYLYQNNPQANSPQLPQRNSFGDDIENMSSSDDIVNTPSNDVIENSFFCANSSPLPLLMDNFDSESEYEMHLNDTLFSDLMI